MCWTEGVKKLGPAEATGIPGVLVGVLPTMFKQLVVAAGRSLCEQRHGVVDHECTEPLGSGASASCPRMALLGHGFFALA